MEYNVRRRSISSRGHGQSLESMLSDGMMQRFHVRAGLAITSPRALARTRSYYKAFLRKLIDTMVVLMQHNSRYEFRLTDVLQACRHHGIRVYGYDDMCTIDGPSGMEELHVTEMVECQTVFNNVMDDGYEGEPDCEPNARFKQTNFIDNVLTRGVDDDGFDVSSDDEWSWYGDSDTESDDEDAMESKSDDRWSKEQSVSDLLMDSLRAAQIVVDEHLLLREPEEEGPECDAPMGQGYHSDCDNDHEPSYMSAWTQGYDREQPMWMGSEDGVLEITGEINDETDIMVDTDEDSVTEDDQVWSSSDTTSSGFVTPRQIFMAAFHSAVPWAINISSVALSALHNVSEQYLLTSLATGELRAQVVTILMEERLAANNKIQLELEEERNKVKCAEQALAEMQKTYNSKELEMQHQIDELERKLRQSQEARNNNHGLKQSPQKWKTPGKRKAASKDIPVADKLDGNPTITTSMVGSLRSTLRGYALHKRARVHPI